VGAVDVVDPATGAVDYMLHQYVGPAGSKAWSDFFAAHPGVGSMHWPHFSLNSGVWRLAALRNVGHFEARGAFSFFYGLRYMRRGYVTAFIPGRYSIHLGKPLRGSRLGSDVLDAMYSRHGLRHSVNATASAYDLNHVIRCASVFSSLLQKCSISAALPRPHNNAMAAAALLLLATAAFSVGSAAAAAPIAVWAAAGDPSPTFERTREALCAVAPCVTVSELGIALAQHELRAGAYGGVLVEVRAQVGWWGSGRGARVKHAPHVTSPTADHRHRSRPRRFCGRVGQARVSRRGRRRRRAPRL
jgi:hypothetical protein